jgi:hypothetical protein
MPEPREKTLSEFDQVDLEYKRMQIEVFRQQMQDRNDRIAALESRRARQVEEWMKGQAVQARKESICKHRKGGRDNKFAKGDSNSYSINKNVYPDGKEIIFCTRCGKEVPKPQRSLKKTDPKLYAEMWAEWVKWNEYPTDNSPSGGQIFLIAAA